MQNASASACWIVKHSVKTGFLKLCPACQLLWLLLTSCDSLVIGQCKRTFCSALTLIHMFTPESCPVQPQSDLLACVSPPQQPGIKCPARGNFSIQIYSVDSGIRHHFFCNKSHNNLHLFASVISKIHLCVISSGQWSAVILFKEKHKQQETSAKSGWFILPLHFQLKWPRHVQILQSIRRV